MTEAYSVRVDTDIPPAGEMPVWTLYVVVADSPEEAMEAVRRVVPPRWKVVATGNKLNPETVERLGLQPGRPWQL